MAGLFLVFLLFLFICSLWSRMIFRCCFKSIDSEEEKMFTKYRFFKAASARR